MPWKVGVREVVMKPSLVSGGESSEGARLVIGRGGLEYPDRESNRRVGHPVAGRMQSLCPSQFRYRVCHCGGPMYREVGGDGCLLLRIGNNPRNDGAMRLRVQQWRYESELLSLVDDIIDCSTLLVNVSHGEMETVEVQEFRTSSDSDDLYA